MADGESLKPIDKLDTEAPMAPMTNTSTYATNTMTKLTPWPHLTHNRSNSTTKAKLDYWCLVALGKTLLDKAARTAVMTH